MPQVQRVESKILHLAARSSSRIRERPAPAPRYSSCGLHVRPLGGRACSPPEPATSPRVLAARCVVTNPAACQASRARRTRSLSSSSEIAAASSG